MNKTFLSQGTYHLREEIDMYKMHLQCLTVVNRMVSNEHT